MSEFKTKHTLQARIKEFDKIKKKYPDRIPVIVEKCKGTSIPDMSRHKFLIPTDLTVGQFLFIIRKRVKLQSNQAIFLFLETKDGGYIIPSSGSMMSQLYKEHVAECGFIYFIYSGESTFGN